jgi:hypothetical protein
MWNLVSIRLGRENSHEGKEKGSAALLIPEVEGAAVVVFSETQE